LTLARITEVIRGRFKVESTLPGADLLLHRIGWSVQVPARQAAEQDEARTTTWREETWPIVKTAADLCAWIYSGDESGQGFRPPKAAPGTARADPGGQP
jgi:Winged helix-turn helix